MRKVLSDNAPPVNPSSVVPYFDCIVLWLRRPVDATTLRKLAKRCAHLEHEERPGRWDRSFHQRLDFKQPNDDALRWIATRSDGIVNYVEVALDLAFPTAPDQLANRDYLDRHLVRRWHRRSQGIRWEGDDRYDDELTRYDAPPAARNKIALYAQDYSRITGELNCLHLEWRLVGLEATRATGLSEPRRYRNFDHRSFWRSRLRLYAVEPGRLGRLFNNRKAGTRRHSITFEDERLGARLLSQYGDTAQDMLDWLGSHRISHVLTPLDTEPYLPCESLYVITDRHHDNLSATRTPASDNSARRRSDDIPIVISAGSKERSGVRNARPPITISSRMKSRTLSALPHRKED
jgi:hypothetical protein